MVRLKGVYSAVVLVDGQTDRRSLERFLNQSFNFGLTCFVLSLVRQKTLTINRLVY